jgi:hypothetical protein
MQKANKEFLQSIEELANKRKNEILNTKDEIVIKGTTYYVASNGNDNNDGLTPNTPWQTTQKVSSYPFKVGDGCCFRRGDVFRGFIKTKPGVTYFAYGTGDKPKLYGWDYNLADKSLWTLVDDKNNIYKLNNKILDCGTLVFDNDKTYSYKHIPSYIDGKFVCRNAHHKDFIMQDEMNDLDIFWRYDERFSTTKSKGEDFPVPIMDNNSYGDLYLKCDKGNPGEVFYSIEAAPRRNLVQISNNTDVTIDNICIKYAGAHAIGAYLHTVGLTVTNCEIGWIGGSTQNFLGLDPNYPQGGRGSVVRFGNGIEIYGGCENYTVKNNYIYQCYDAGITHQFTTNSEAIKMTGIRYIDNVVETCVYSIEYFLEQKGTDKHSDSNGSYMDDMVISGNILRLSGYGWGQQRHNKNTPAHIKGWNYENTASNFVIKNNIFDRAKFKIIHTVARKESSLPKLEGNTYVQELGAGFGLYGANEFSEPKEIIFDKDVEQKIKSELKEKDAKIYFVK